MSICAYRDYKVNLKYTSVEECLGVCRTWTYTLDIILIPVISFEYEF